MNRYKRIIIIAWLCTIQAKGLAYFNICSFGESIPINNKGYYPRTPKNKSEIINVYLNNRTMHISNLSKATIHYSIYSNIQMLLSEDMLVSGMERDVDFSSFDKGTYYILIETEEGLLQGEFSL